MKTAWAHLIYRLFLCNLWFHLLCSRMVNNLKKGKHRRCWGPSSYVEPLSSSRLLSTLNFSDAAPHDWFLFFFGKTEWKVERNLKFTFSPFKHLKSSFHRLQSFVYETAPDKLLFQKRWRVLSTYKRATWNAMKNLQIIVHWNFEEIWCFFEDGKWKKLTGSNIKQRNRSPILAMGERWNFIAAGNKVDFVRIFAIFSLVYLKV